MPVRWTVVPFTETENVGEVREQGRSWTRWGWVPLRHQGGDVDEAVGPAPAGQEFRQEVPGLETHRCESSADAR